MPLDDEQYQSLAGFRYALRQFSAASERISRAGGITQQQYQALLAIKTWPGGSMSMKDLAEQLLLTHHAAVQLVDRLAKAGLAERTPSREDRRSVVLSLTASGDSLLGVLVKKHLAEVLRQEPLLAKSLKRLRRMGG
jgi:DNA-binding MarR family transcriptional regulator